MRSLLIAMALLLSSCGVLREQARENVLIPAAATGWGTTSSTGVRADVLRGIEDAVFDGDLVDDTYLMAEVERLSEMLESDGGTYFEWATIPWTTLETYGFRGVQDRVEDGEIHPLVADSLYERIRNMGKAINSLSAPPVSPQVNNLGRHKPSRIATPQVVFAQ